MEDTKKVGITRLEYNPDTGPFPFRVSYARMSPVRAMREVRLKASDIPQDVLDLLDRAARRMIEIADELDTEAA